MKKILFAFCSVFIISCNDVQLSVTPSANDLQYNELAQVWDEGIPLGNATVGALIWQKGNSLRFSLDRTDLWDLRPMDSISGPNNRFAWVKEQVIKGDYLPVQKKYDWPYDREPAPSKIPGAALEISLEKIGTPSSVRLYLDNALCEAVWENGIRMKTFVHATEPVGWFVFENLNDSLAMKLVPPSYNLLSKGADNMGGVATPDLERLGYDQGTISEKEAFITYHQKGWGDFYYDVAVKWQKKGNRLIGTWSVTSSLGEGNAVEHVDSAMLRGVDKDYKKHMEFWEEYWAASSVNLPDTVLQKQYMNEMYKFGSATREDSYPVSLQAVWTADNGKLPPWKGDYHHDLNTQLSYWPAYIGNHLEEGLGYLNTLWDQRDVYKQYTRTYFEADGMNIPGVCTLTGEPMGGWIQYSMSPTVSAWLAQHFYLHWKYSADREFLKERAYPFIKDAVVFLEQISVINEEGKLTLPISSSPEIFDNSIRAWFRDITNYDLGLMHFAFGTAAELAQELNKKEEAAHWAELKAQLPFYALSEDGALAFAKGFPYEGSHRHFSHAMAFHPLATLDWSQGEESQKIISATIKRLEDFGPDYWTGYSYSWLANMYARVFDGEKAAGALRDFANCFCLKNTFHANGDQTKSGKSLFTYRPFTLEGNMAFASGVQEMLLQSHTGLIRVFPAIPSGWKEVSFDKLRAMGAFLISAEKKDGEVKKVRIYSEKGGTLRMLSPFGSKQVTVTGNREHYDLEKDIITIRTIRGEWVELSI